MFVIGTGSLDSGLRSNVNASAVPHGYLTHQSGSGLLIRSGLRSAGSNFMPDRSDSSASFVHVTLGSGLRSATRCSSCSQRGQSCSSRLRINPHFRQVADFSTTCCGAPTPPMDLGKGADCSASDLPALRSEEHTSELQ